MENIAQQLAVIDPGSAWLLPIPLDGFTMPKFSFGQKVMSQSRETIGRIIGISFAPDGSELAYQISPGVNEHPCRKLRACLKSLWSKHFGDQYFYLLKFSRLHVCRTE